MLQEKITLLKKNIIEYGLFVKSMIDLSINGLLNVNSVPLEEVIEKLEPKANNFEIELDEMCLSMIAQYQPKAKDLRTITMILKMNNDLERIGDSAVNICESGLYLISKPSVKPLIDIPKMAQESLKMLDDSVKSFINEDIALARDVLLRDNTVDNFNDQIIRELITYMMSDPSTIERSIHLIRISRNLERIADLSTNICEDVLFIVEGKIIKHHHDK
jgi:phosphate transport system protein